MNHGNRRWSVRTGFTLIETMMVLVVLGMIALIGTPKLSASLGHARARAAVNRFVAAHSLAKATAIRYGRRAELWIDAAGGTFWIRQDSTGLGGNVLRITPAATVGDGVTLASNRAILCFNGRGLPTTAGACEAPDATVVISTADRADTLTITPLGKILR